MQQDMHYYGTYAMARAAGLRPQVCDTIATAAQFVDDNALSRTIEFLDGARIDSEPSAHHLADVSNVDAADQRQVWVPFHFLPGNRGESFSERLICRKDSEIAREMVDHHLRFAGRDIGPYLLGIAAHVYADTFSHYGFSGVSSRHNKVVNDSIRLSEDLELEVRAYIEGKAARFFVRHRREAGLIANMKSWLAETVSGALGHGAVATYPDRPYLSWSFEYEYPAPARSHRDNPVDYLEACRKLHQVFRRFATTAPITDDGDVTEFAEISPTVESILSFQGDESSRIGRWRQAAARGELADRPFVIPDYNPEVWLRNAARLAGEEDSAPALSDDLYRFFRAASTHRHYVLRDLLPRHGLVVA